MIICYYYHMNDALSPYKELYLKTAKQYLTSMIEDLEKLQTAQTDKGIIMDFYISSHSMKGQSIAMEFTSTSTLCRLLERIAHKAKEGTLQLSHELIIQMQSAVSHMIKNLEKIKAENNEDDFSNEINQLKGMTGIIL